MASGNTWQVYQELGGCPASVVEVMKQFPQARRRPRRTRRATTIEHHSPAMAVLGEDGAVTARAFLAASPSATNLGYANDGFNRDSGREASLERRHSFSQAPIVGVPSTAETPRKTTWSPRRSSVSFRVAKEKGRQLWRRAKTFLDVTVAGVVGSTTPPPSPETGSTSSTTTTFRFKNADNQMEIDDDDFFTTVSDLSGFRSDDDEYNSFSQVIAADAFRRSEEDRSSLELHRRRKYSNASQSHHGPDPNCPIHGEGSGVPHKRVSIARRSSSSRDRYHRSASTYNENRKVRGFEIDNEIESEPRRLESAGGDSTRKKQRGSISAPSFMLKLARRRHKAALTIVDRQRVEREKSKILRNLCTLSVAFLFLISAFQGLQNLQTSIHGDSGLGAISLSVVYFGLVTSCLFTPPYLINRIGCKLTLILSMSTFSLYMLTHFIPKWYSLLPGSLLVGFGAAPLWAAKCNYLSETGFRYAELNLESSNVVIVRFFGIFFMIVHTGQVFGNLISSWILRAAMGSGSEAVDGVDETCGHFFSHRTNLSPIAEANLSRPSTGAVNSLYAVYCCCTVVAFLIIGMFLNQLRKDMRIQREKPHFKLDIWNTTVQHLRKPRHLLLVPLTIFNGMQQAFIAGEFTKAYVGCCLGVTQIGYVMMSFGMFDAVCSLVFGPLIKLFGRMPLLMFGAVVDMLMIFTLVVWPPNPADTVIFYVIAACWGMADGVWSTQINGLWVVIFADNLAAAFANYRLWESVGFIIAFAYTPFLSTEAKLYVLLAMLYVGMLGYGIIELYDPLEDYALRLKEKLHTKSSLRLRSTSRRRRNSSLKKKRNGGDDAELTETLLGASDKSATTDNKIAPLASETDL